MQSRVLQRRQFAPHAVLVLEINWRDNDAFLIRGAREHASPWIDDHRIAVVAVAVNVGTELRGRDHVRLVLDRAGANQRLPMRFAGRERERARNRDNLCAGKSQASIKFREAQVVADAESDRAKRSAGGDDVGAGELGVGLAHRHAAGKIDVEQMNLAIHGDLLAVGAKQHRRVVASRVAGDLLGDRSSDDVDLQLARQPRHQRQRLTVERFRRGGLLVALAAPVEDFGQRDQVRAARRTDADQPFGAFQVAGLSGPAFIWIAAAR